MFTAIKINDENYKFITEDENGKKKEEWEINWLNKINIFVWQNNSGKSRFIRGIINQKNISYRDIWKDFCIKIYSELEKYLEKITYKSYESEKLLSYLNTYHIENIFSKATLTGEGSPPQNDSIVKLQGIYWLIDSIHNEDLKLDITKISKKIQLEWEKINLPQYEVIRDLKCNIVYIPLLRWLKNPIKHGKDDIYYNRTQVDYFQDPSKIEIFTWLTLYEDINKMLRWEDEEKKNKKAFEDFLSTNFFNWETIDLTPKYDSDVLHIDIWNIKNKAIYDLWDWIQSIIINTFPLFKYKDENLLLFIEEPEMWIHPWMQRILLNTFANWIEGQKWEHQIYFTTHSNHFLDIALDKEINDKISIYQFRETENEKEKHITNISQNKEILDLLWVRNSSVFLSNCIIWVEWISDRIYIRKFLELYQEKQKKSDKNFKIFEEDKNYSIVEYGGSNIEHFNFLWLENGKINTVRVNRNNFILADNDGKKYKWKIKSTDDEKTIRLKKLRSKLWNSFYCEYTEIENTLWAQVLMNYIDSIDFSRKAIDKNIKNLSSINWENKIWDIIRSHFIKLKPKKKKPNYYDYSHIWCIWEDKTTISRFIVDNILKDYSLLSKDVLKLIQKLYKFIENNNDWKS